jgi:hypothetical protein
LVRKRLRKLSVQVIEIKLTMSDEFCCRASRASLVEDNARAMPGLTRRFGGSVPLLHAARSVSPRASASGGEECDNRSGKYRIIA